jgi:flagellar protein FlbD
MIAVHRHNHPESQLWLNPDLIQQIETTPDTVIMLTNDTRLVVIETPAEVIDLIQAWRSEIIRRAGRPEVVKTVVALPTT